MSHKIIPTQEMLNDLRSMSYDNFCLKWSVSRRIPIRLVKEYGIKPFNNVGKTIEHKFEGEIEYKWCQKGHWEVVSKFYKCPSRNDGLRCICIQHSRSEFRKQYRESDGGYLNKSKEWLKTEKGQLHLRNTWRRKSAKRKEIYVSWTREDEEKAYSLFECRCAYCGKPVSITRIEFDHFIPISSGGKTEPSNMIPCCTRCNHGSDGKFNREALEWLSFKFGETRGKLIYDDVQKKINSLGDIK